MRLPERIDAGPGIRHKARLPFAGASAGPFLLEQSVAVPKRKTSPSRRGMRRAHDALAPNTYIEDAETGELRRPHHIDLKTGKYRGRQVLKPKDE